MSTTIVCTLKACAHNTADRCKCQVIGIEQDSIGGRNDIIGKCDSYIPLPQIDKIQVIVPPGEEGFGGDKWA